MAFLKLMADGKDYGQYLRRRRWVAAAMLAVGAVGLLCYFLLVPGSGLDDYAQGFYLGGATGIALGAAILLVRTQYLLRHPAAYQKAKVKETDERERTVIHRAFEAAGMTTFFTGAGALFVLLPISGAAFRAVLGMMTLYALTFIAAQLILQRRM